MKSIKSILAAMSYVAVAQCIAADRVLIMTISDYPEQPLAGVKFDADNALRLAARLGYDTSNALILRDRQLTAAGMREAFRKLSDQVQPNDRVFVYYSGHGASQHKEGQCVQSLVTQDLGFVDTAELALHLDRVKEKTSDGLVILDACHSGGNRDIAVARGLGGKIGQAGAEVTAKAWTPKSGEQCAQPVNRLAKSWQAGSARVARGMANPENNFTLVAAANEREQALDDAYKGGLATLGLLDCASSGVADLDGSQSASIREVAACAQQYIAKRVPEINQRSGLNFLPHTLEVYGNVDKTLPVRITVASSAPKDRASQVLASFRSLEKNSNGNYRFNFESSASEVVLGSDVQLTFKTEQPAYAYLFYVGSDRKDIKQLWPPEGQLRRLEPGRKSLTLTIEKPAGDNTFLAIATQTPMDIGQVLGGSGSASATMQTLQAIGCAGQQLRNASLKDESAGCSVRNASLKAEVVGEGIAGYAARIVTVKGK